MRSKLEFSFEQIDELHFRAKVRGGWLVKVVEDVFHGKECPTTGWDSRVAMAFVPDTNHEWVVEGGE